jgi:hypothetical protein
MNPTELVERVIELGHERLSETLERLHPDVPEPVTSSLTQNGDVVLVYGQLRVPHTRGRRFVEMQQIAWVYEVEGDRVARVTIYRTWAEARRAAGIEPGTPPTRRFSSWQLLQFVPA